MKPWQDLTDMFTDSEMIDEMSKKYKNTYLRIINDGVSSLALYCGFDDDGFHRFKDRHGSILKIKHETEVQIKLWNPRRGLYNTSNGVVVFTRSPFRQFRRGINHESGKIHTLQRYILGAGHANLLNDLIYELFSARNDRTTPLAEAIEKVQKTNEWAINREFAVTLNHLTTDPERYSLFYEQYYIGYVKGKEIFLEAPEFTQEILDTQAEWAPDYIVRG